MPNKNYLIYLVECRGYYFSHVKIYAAILFTIRGHHNISTLKYTTFVYYTIQYNYFDQVEDK